MTKLIVNTLSAVKQYRFDPLKYRPANIFKRAGRRGRKLQPVPNLSAASKCVWQMDREA